MIFSSTVGLKVTRALLCGLDGADIVSRTSSASSNFRIVPDSVDRWRSGLLELAAGAETGSLVLGTRATMIDPGFRNIREDDWLSSISRFLVLRVCKVHLVLGRRFKLCRSLCVSTNLSQTSRT